MISAVWAMLLDSSMCNSVCLPCRALLSSDSSYKHFKKVTTNYNNKLIWPKILSMERIKQNIYTTLTITTLKSLENQYSTKLWNWVSSTSGSDSWSKSSLVVFRLQCFSFNFDLWPLHNFPIRDSAHFLWSASGMRATGITHRAYHV